MRWIDSVGRLAPANRRLLVPIGVWAGLAVMDAVLWSRWFSGWLTVPLPTALVWISTACTAAAALAALVCWRHACPRRSPASVIARLPDLATLLIPLLWGIVAGWGTSPYSLGGLVALWGLSIVGFGLIHVWGPVFEGETASEEVSESEYPRHDENSTNWQRRVVVGEGEMIEGGARIQFAPGQRETVLHLAFCPPLAATPVIHAEDGDGSELEFRTDAAHTFGARLSIRRRAGVDAAECRDIEYAAVPAEPR